MSKERLKQFKNSLDFLDDSADMSDYHRLIDTLENLYKDGELDWVHRYAREKAGRVQELEKRLKVYQKRSWFEDYEKVAKQNKRYRERVAQLINYIEMTDDETDRQVHKIHVILDGLLEGDSDE